MHPVLTTLESELRQLAAAVKSTSGDDRSASEMHSNGLTPSLDRHELSQIAIKLADRIASEGGDEVKTNGDLLAQYQSRLQFMRSNTVAHLFNGNGNTAIPAYLLTLDAFDKFLNTILAIDSSKVTEDVRTAKSITTKLRGLSARVEELQPKADTLQKMANEIVQAHAAADQLPTDLATLREAREEIESLRNMAKKDRDAAGELLEEMKKTEEAAKLRVSQSEQYQKKQVEDWKKISESTQETAAGLIAKCDDAMRTSTSLGLAGAFHEQAKGLKLSMWGWVLGLVAALASGAYFGGQQLHELSQAIEASTPPMIIWTRLFISLLSVGAPVWFAWLATKQIGQRFRLAEDYAYKASISKAYEGYRREAVELDVEFQTKLFASALARLDEQPLRFVEHKTHGSPWHEVLDSDLVKEAIKIAPELAGKIKELATEKISEAKRKKAKAKVKAEAESVAEDAESNQ